MTTARSFATRTLLAYRRIVIITTTITAALYSVFVLYPGYASGIYRLSDTQIEWFDIDPPLIGQGGPVALAILAFVLIYLIAVPLQFINLLTLISRKDGLSIEQKVFWLVITIELWLALYVTGPAAGAIATWAFD
jgi:hypothetical protein